MQRYTFKLFCELYYLFSPYIIQTNIKYTAKGVKSFHTPDSLQNCKETSTKSHSLIYPLIHSPVICFVEFALTNVTNFNDLLYEQETKAFTQCRVIRVLPEVRNNFEKENFHRLQIIKTYTFY